MDVICERCGTEYEFDETLLSTRGTSVKCTNCGQVFKVYPGGVDREDPASSTWKLKLGDGSIDTIDSLRELQRRIGKGELTPDDAISRGDEDWKPLGSIPELETFFQAAGVPVESGRIPSPLPPIAPEGADSSIPPGRRPRQPTLLGVMPVEKPQVSEGVSPEDFQGALESAASTSASESVNAIEGATEAKSVSAGPIEPEPVSDSVSGTEPEPASEPGEVSLSDPDLDSGWFSTPEPEAKIDSGWKPAPEPTAAPEGVSQSPEDSYESPYHSDSLVQSARARALETVEDAVFEERPRRRGRPSTPPPAYFDDDEDIPELPGRGSSPLRWLLLVVAIGALALVVSQWDRVARLLGFGADLEVIAAGITEGDAGLAKGHARGYADAIEAYGRAVEAGGERDSELLAKLSNAYALAAQAQVDEGASGADVDALRAAALSTAQSATALDPRDIEAKLAQADALRLAGQHGEARTTLEDARSMSFSRTAELYRVDARLSAAEADGRLENGLRSARQAAQLAPDGVRYLLLWARAEHAAGNDERAIEPLQTILDDDPDHPVATALLEALEAPEAAVDAGMDVAIAITPATIIIVRRVHK